MVLKGSLIALIARIAVMAPFKVFLAASIAITLILKLRLEAYLPSRNLLTTFVEILAVETVAWLVWRCLLYPKLFSPLRALPGPSVYLHHLPVLFDNLNLIVLRAVHFSWANLRT